MAPKRLPFSFAEFEPKGRRAILRTAEDIRAENNSLELNTGEVNTDRLEDRGTTSQEKNDRTNVQTKEQELANGRTTGRSNEQATERAKVRHSFDVYKDQLLALNELQTKGFRATGRKPGISEIVQEALDKYLSSSTRKDVRTNERPNNK